MCSSDLKKYLNIITKSILSKKRLREDEIKFDKLRSYRLDRVRKKIEDDPTMPIWLQTVRGKGYILRPSSQ